MKLNKLNHDGSVNSYYETNIPGHGYTVPFNIENFKDQIEDKIYPSVELLNFLGYETVTSCHGHSFYHYLFKKGIIYSMVGPNITIKIKDSLVCEFKKNFSSVLFKTVNKAEEEHEKSPENIYVKIQTRFPLVLFLSNDFICKKMYELISKNLN